MQGEAFSKGSGSKSPVPREVGGNYSSYLPLGSQVPFPGSAGRDMPGVSTELKVLQAWHKQQLGTWARAKEGGVQRKWLNLGSKSGWKGSVQEPHSRPDAPEPWGT